MEAANQNYDRGEIGEYTLVNPIKEQEIRITGTHTQDWIILAITALLIVIFWAIIIWKALSDIPDIQSSTGTQVLVQCPIGQCATNIYNGEKRCPETEGTIVSNAGIEVCSSRYLCDNVSLPYSVQADGSTNSDGTCEEGVTCRCLRYPTCPDYVTSYFTAITGSAYGSVIGTRTTFSQTSSWTDRYTGIKTSNRPLQYRDSSISFCSVPAAWMLRSTPGCTFTQDLTMESIADCMAYQNGIDGVYFNPCLQGTLAFVTSDSSTFDVLNPSTVQRTPMACVAAEPCESGQVAVWDTSYNGLVCKGLTIP